MIAARRHERHLSLPNYLSRNLRGHYQPLGCFSSKRPAYHSPIEAVKAFIAFRRAGLPALWNANSSRATSSLSQYKSATGTCSTWAIRVAMR